MAVHFYLILFLVVDLFAEVADEVFELVIFIHVVFKVAVLFVYYILNQHCTLFVWTDKNEF